MKLHPLHPHAALLLEDAKDRKYIAISDLHIGFESALGAKGITLESKLVQEMLDELLTLVESQKADGLILLGDIKDTVGSISKQEWDEIPEFFRTLASKADVYLVPGNHDGNIKYMLPQQVNIISSRGMVIDDTLLVHGHSMPSDVRANVKRIVMGHVHPVFLKRGSVIHGERVWIYLNIKKETLFPSTSGRLDVVVVPSFNKYLYVMNERGYRRSISPIITRALQSDGIREGMIVTLDGSIVGDVTMLEHIV